jgi:hypothetical protein
MITTVTMPTVMATTMGLSTTVAAATATQAAATTSQVIAKTTCAPVKTRKLSITADDQIAELYVNGVQTSFQHFCMSLKTAQIVL